MLIRHKQLCLAGQDQSLYFTPIKCHAFKAQPKKSERVGFTVLPEKFSGEIYFRLIFTVGARLRKICSWIFLSTRKSWLHGIYFHLRMHGFFINTVKVLLCSSYFVLNKLLMRFLLQYLRAVSNNRQCPKWVCLTYMYCTHAEILTKKLASSDLPFV